MQDGSLMRSLNLLLLHCRISSVNIECYLSLFSRIWHPCKHRLRYRWLF